MRYNISFYSKLFPAGKFVQKCIINEKEFAFRMCTSSRFLLVFPNSLFDSADWCLGSAPLAALSCCFHRLLAVSRHGRLPVAFGQEMDAREFLLPPPSPYSSRYLGFIWCKRGRQMNFYSNSLNGTCRGKRPCRGLPLTVTCIPSHWQLSGMPDAGLESLSVHQGEKYPDLVQWWELTINKCMFIFLC